MSSSSLISIVEEQNYVEKRKKRIKDRALKAVSELPSQELIPTVFSQHLSKIPSNVAYAVQKASLSKEFESAIQRVNFKFSFFPNTELTSSATHHTDEENDKVEFLSDLSSESKSSSKSSSSSPCHSTIQEIASSISQAQQEVPSIPLSNDNIIPLISLKIPSFVAINEDKSRSPSKQTSSPSLKNPSSNLQVPLKQSKLFQFKLSNQNTPRGTLSSRNMDESNATPSVRKSDFSKDSQGYSFASLANPLTYMKKNQVSSFKMFGKDQIKKNPLNLGNKLTIPNDETHSSARRRSSFSKSPTKRREESIERDPSLETMKIKNIVSELNQAKKDLLDSSRGMVTKQSTLFQLDTPSNSNQTPKSKTSQFSSKFKPINAALLQRKPNIYTKNSFDSDSEEQNIEEEKKTQKPKLMRKKAIFERVESEEEDNTPKTQVQESSQTQNTIKSSIGGSNATSSSGTIQSKGFKSINSIALMILGKKHWYNVQNRDISASRKSKEGDELFKKINQLNLRFPVISFCTHRIGRFQNWKINYVNYFSETKCFQINFLSLDNLFYKMFVPAKELKDFSNEQDSFITIWPIVLHYLLSYLAQKKIELSFDPQVQDKKKIDIQDHGLKDFMDDQYQLPSLALFVSNKIMEYKIDRRGEIKSFRTHMRMEEDPTPMSNISSTSSYLAGKIKFNFFLGLARKESYFPTIRDALAASKIKKIFEILLYRYMYDQLRPTGKKLVLKKDASTQRYKTLSKKIQKLENDLEKSQMKQQLKVKEGNSVDIILSQKFGTFQFRKLIQKDVMKIPDKSEYQIEQIWKLRHKESPYPLCSFIKKTSEGTYYLVSFSLAFKKGYNALLTMFMKKKEDNTSLKDQFDKIISVQQLKKPILDANEEELQKEKAQREQKLLLMLENQVQPGKRLTERRNSSYKPLQIQSSPLPSSQPEINKKTTKKPVTSKVFPDENFSQIFASFDLSSLIKQVVFTQKIPKNFKQLCIKNIKRRIVIKDDLLFLRQEKADIMKRKQLQPPQILVEIEVPDENDLRMRDFMKKQSIFEQRFTSDYTKSEFVHEKPNTKHRANEAQSDFSDSNDDSFNGFTYPLSLIQVEEEFDRLDKMERLENSLFHELQFRSYWKSSQSLQKAIHYVTTELHGEYKPTFTYKQIPPETHIIFSIRCPQFRYQKIVSSQKPKAIALFYQFKNFKFKNEFPPPIQIDTSKKEGANFSISIMKIFHKKTIGEITKRTEIAIPNLGQLPAHQSLKLSLLKNTSFMESQRSFKRFSIIDEIRSFGKIFLTLSLFFDNENGMLFALEFQDFISKSRLYRMALNDHDMAELLGLVIFPEDPANIIIKVMRRLVSHIRFDQDSFYRIPCLSFGEIYYRSELQVPSKNQVEGRGIREQGDQGRKFFNKISKHTFEKEDINKTKYLMDGAKKSNRIIFHRTIQCGGEFYIITIQKNLILSEFWMIVVYSPKSGRRIKGYAQNRDFQDLQFKSLSQGMSIFHLFDEEKPFLNYKSFSENADKRSFQFVSPNQVEKTNFLLVQVQKLNEEEQQQLDNSPVQQYPSVIKDIHLAQSSGLPSARSKEQISKDQYVQSSKEIMQVSIIKTNELPSEEDDEEESCSIHASPIPRLMTNSTVILPKSILERAERMQGTQLLIDSSNDIEATNQQMKIILVEKFLQVTTQLSKATKSFAQPNPRLDYLTRFVEIKIWENIIEQMKLVYKGGCHVMQFGTVAIPMQEYISTGQVVTDSGQEIIVEYFIGKEKDKEGELLLTKSFEEISYPQTLSFFVFLRFYYFNQVGIMHKKINLRELLNLFIADGYYKYQTNYMHSKLQQQDLSQLCDFVSFKLRTGTFGSILNQTHSQFKRTGLDSYSRKTLQTLVKEQELEEVENSIAEVFLFSKKPYRIVKIYIKLTKRIVEFLIYSPINSSTFKKSYSITSFHLSIPFISFYFQAGLYRQLAKNFLSLLHQDLSESVKKHLTQRHTVISQKMK